MNEKGETGVLWFGQDGEPYMIVGNLKGEIDCNDGKGKTWAATTEDRERFFSTLYMSRKRQGDVIDAVRSYAVNMVRTHDDQLMAVGLEIIDLLLEKKNPAG